jgi:hypothetical protein
LFRHRITILCAYGEFERQRWEVEQFAKSVTGSLVKFSWKSYLELWHEWAIEESTWLQADATNLMKRCGVSI